MHFTSRQPLVGSKSGYLERGKKYQAKKKQSKKEFDLMPRPHKSLMKSLATGRRPRYSGNYQHRYEDDPSSISGVSRWKRTIQKKGKDEIKYQF